MYVKREHVDYSEYFKILTLNKVQNVKTVYKKVIAILLSGYKTIEAKQLSDLTVIQLKNERQYNFEKF